ncbi:MAG: AsmA family protein [Candidatus Thiodiazotropha sp.]
MGKTLKVLAWLVGMLVVVIVAAIILVPMFVDPNDHKARIIAEVKKATGRDLGITGDIGLSVFPRLALELNGLTLSNAPGFKQTDFATIQHAQVGVNLWPLLFKQILEVDSVQIEGVRLYLAKAKDGTTNWDDLSGKSRTGKKPDGPKVEAPKDAEMGVFAFTIGGLNVDDANLVWDDQSTGNHYEIRNIQLETGEVAPKQPVDLNFGLSFSSAQPSLSSTLSLTTRLTVDPDAESLTLEKLLLQVSAQGEGLPEKGVDGELLADVRLNLKENSLDIQNMEVKSGELSLTGNMEAVDIQTRPSYKGNLHLAEFNPRDWMQQFGIAVPETADEGVLQSLHVGASFTGNDAQVKLDDLLVKFDQSTLKGGLEVIDFASPSYLFNLDLDQIDLDRYLPPPQEGTAAVPRKPARGGAAKEAPLLPVETLRKLRFDGTVRVGSLTINRLHAKAILLKLRGRDGKLNLDHEIGRFYDGLLKGDVQVDVKGEAPKLKINETASRILSGPLLMDLTGKDTLLGSGNLDMNLTTAGNTVTQFKRHLNGNVKFDFHDGAVKGFNLAKMIRDTKARLNGENVVTLDEPEQTDFSELNGTAVIENGVVNNQSLLAKSPYIRVEGSGKAYLLEERLKYEIRPVIVNTSAGQGGESLEDLKGIPIPVKIKGNWNDPEISIQLAKILEDQQKARLKQKYEEKVDETVNKQLEEKLPEDLQDQLKDKLKKLF